MSKKSSTEIEKIKTFSIYDPKKPLSKIYLKKAAKELKEDPAQVPAHLESFRRWIRSMPHLSSTEDENLLLAFLRHAKFNHMKAQARFDKFCTFRTSSTEGNPDWFKDTPERRKIWEKWLELKCWGPLGITSDGVLVAMMKWASVDLTDIPLDDLQGAFQLWTDLGIIDARTQIGGICMIMDLTDLKKETMMRMFDPKISKLMTKYFQECLPFRINKLIYYNAPKFFEALFKFYLEWLNEKIKSKIMLISGDFSPAFDAVPGLKDVVPYTLGGNCKFTFEQICEANMNVLKNVPSVGDDFKISVDESKRPKECRYSFGTYKDVPNDIMGKSGTYVKLNNDEL